MVSVTDLRRDTAPETPRRPTRRPVAIVVLVVALVAGAGALGLWAGRSTAPGPPPASVGNAFDRAVPASVLALPLVDQQGATTSLASYRGRIVLVAPFLTSCQEVCPITTGALLQVRQALAAAGLGDRVVVAEVTVDPGRDSPARLAAYAQRTGVRFPLLTGSPATLDALWRFFGVDHTVVPEDSPPGIDWETGQPYTYDVDHGDGFLMLDGRGHERFATGGLPHLQGALAPSLQAMLDGQGRQNQSSPGPGAWTVGDALDAIGWIEGRAVP
ncbi:MAG TPA: SCO family protein [Acidimicrobiales bacterium]|nr:SCO family protein [Acidimicrobiales bacterium]